LILASSRFQPACDPPKAMPPETGRQDSKFQVEKVEFIL